MKMTEGRMDELISKLKGLEYANELPNQDVHCPSQGNTKNKAVSCRLGIIAQTYRHEELRDAVVGFLMTAKENFIDADRSGV